MTRVLVGVPTERDFTAQVLDLLRVCHWRTLHLRPARTSHGWATPIQGDGKGWPDIFAVRRDRLIAAELKVGRNRPTVEQVEWLDALRFAGVETFIWTPADWAEIPAVLR